MTALTVTTLILARMVYGSGGPLPDPPAGPPPWKIVVVRYARGTRVTARLYKPYARLFRWFGWRYLYQQGVNTEDWHTPDATVVSHLLGYIPASAGYVIHDPDGPPDRWDGWSSEDAYQGTI